MAEYGLYGAMVRHSLPLPETIMRQQQQQQLQNQLQQQSNRSSRSSNSDCENEDAATGLASAAGSSLRETQQDDGGAQVISTTETETQVGNESESDCSTAPWLLGMHKKSLEISGRLKSNNSSSSYHQLTNERACGDSTAIAVTTTETTASNETSNSAAIAAEVSKKRELSSIFMSVKRILACGQPEESEQAVKDKKNTSDASEINQLTEGSTNRLLEHESPRSNKFSAGKIVNSSSKRHQRSRSNFQQKRRLSKAAAQKLAEMRQQQLEESAAVHGAHFENHIEQQAAAAAVARMNESGNNIELINEQLTPIQKSTLGNQGVEELNGFINRVCQVQAQQQQQQASVQNSSVCGPQNTFFADMQQPSYKAPVMASNQQHGLLLPGQQQNLLNSLHHLYYPPQPQAPPPQAAAAFTSAAQQHQQLSAATPINMFGLRPHQQEQADLAQIGLFAKNPSSSSSAAPAANDSLHQLLSYHASNQIKRLQPRHNTFQALDSVGHSHEQQAQQLLMAAAAATINGQNQSQTNSNLWLNEWMQRYMLSHSAAMLAAQQQQHQQQLQPQLQQQQQRQLVLPRNQEQQSRASFQEATTKSRRNNFSNVANLIEANEDEVDIDVVRPFVSSSLSLSQQTMLLNEDGDDSNESEKSSSGRQDLKARKLISANGAPEVARNFHQVN